MYLTVHRGIHGEASSIHEHTSATATSRTIWLSVPQPASPTVGKCLTLQSFVFKKESGSEEGMLLGDEVSCGKKREWGKSLAVCECQDPPETNNAGCQSQTQALGSESYTPAFGSESNRVKRLQ